MTLKIRFAIRFLAMGAALSGSGCHAVTESSSEESGLTPEEQTRASIIVKADDEATEQALLSLLAPMVKSFVAVFGVSVDGLVIRVISDPADPEFGYDSFDHATNTIAMQWSWEDLGYTRWLLAHELAHAFEFAFDPQAYIEEPSWIHEGWAEYAVWKHFARQDPDEGREFLQLQSVQYLRNDAPFRKVVRNVYAFDWPTSYPVCFLLVHYLADQNGEESIANFFRVHGRERSLEALRRLTGQSISSLASSLNEHARQLRSITEAPKSD